MAYRIKSASINMQIVVILLNILALVQPLSMEGQIGFEINPPLVDTLEYKITDSVFVAVDGNDENSGTHDRPLKSFKRAIEMLPFGTPDINEGHSYGLIIIKEGKYTETLNQNLDEWKQGNTTKNISVRGEGEVMIGGEADSALVGHLILLRGSHIYIKNLKLRYGSIIGLFLPGEAKMPLVQHDIVLEKIEVDSVGSHGVLISYCERVQAKNVVVRHAGAYEPPIPPFPCRSWPSGFKCYMSSNLSIMNSEVSRNWGEGINFHNCSNSLVESCLVSDNYAVNMYNDNSSKYIARNNIIHNTIGGMEHWRACYGYENAQIAPIGFSLANERSCPTSHGFITNRTKNCELECYHPTNGTFRLTTIDSVFIYNNFILNTGASISFWEGVTELGTSCITNIWFVHNTCIGFESSTNIRNTAFVNFNFASGVNLALNPLSSIQSTTIAQNIFSFNSDNHPNIHILRRVLDPIFPAPFQVHFLRNIWNQTPATFGQEPNSTVHSNLPTELVKLDIDTWDDEYWSEFYNMGNMFEFARFDFFGNERVKWNQGAIETSVLNYNSIDIQDTYMIYPNPAQESIFLVDLKYKSPYELRYNIINMQGINVQNGTINSIASTIQNIDIKNLTPGVFRITFIIGEKVHDLPFIKQ